MKPKRLSRRDVVLSVLLHIGLLCILSLAVTDNTHYTTTISSSVSTKIVHAVAISQTQLSAQVHAIQRAKRLKLKIAHEKHEKLLRLARERKIRKRQHALLKKQKLLQKKWMQKELSKEQKALHKVNVQASNGVVDKYKAQIVQLIQSRWHINQVNAKIKCVYAIDIGPGGVVLSLKLIKSSGDAALDQSARTAIMQSSPLPVPNDPALFERFRQLRLTLSPQGFVRG